MTQNDEFLKLYGEAMFQTYLVEDLLITHLLSCAQFHVNGYSKSCGSIRELSLRDAIQALAVVYNQSSDIDKLILPLHCIRRIRNKLTHGFVTQVGEDLRTEAGRDQISGMLSEVSKLARVYLRILQGHHEETMKLALKNDVMSALGDEYDPEGAGKVSLSEIQKEIDDFKSGLGQRG